ncbi:MAG: PadR family transcriptional regulator [Leucobacter sp.]
MAHVILGLLMLWPQSLYELTKNFEAGVSLIYSSSTGSIKRALDQLLAAGRVTVESASGSRGKKIYAITDAGRTEFHRWMLENDPAGDIETATLSRAFFLGLVTPEEQLQISALIRERMQESLRQLERLEARIATEDVPAEFTTVARYQVATLQYGLTSHRAALAWADEHLPRA